MLRGESTVSVKVSCGFRAALLEYSGYWLFQVTTEGRDTTYHFEMSDWSADEILGEQGYDSAEGQPVSNIKAYVEALKKVQHLQGLARRSGLWVDENWQAGKRNKEEN